MSIQDQLTEIANAVTGSNRNQSVYSAVDALRKAGERAIADRLQRMWETDQPGPAPSVHDTKVLIVTAGLEVILRTDDHNRADTAWKLLPPCEQVS